MNYDVELVSCKIEKVLAIKKLREVLGCDLSKARYYVENIPCVILADADEYEAKKICMEICSQVGEARLVEKEFDERATYVPNASISAKSDYGTVATIGEREKLSALWSEYTRRERNIKKATQQLESNEHKIETLKKDVDRIQKEIEKNEKIKASNGECLRPEYNRCGLFDQFYFPEFDTVKIVFLVSAIAIAVLSFIVMLVMVAVNPSAIENLAASLNVLAGALVWLGAPVLGLASGVGCVVLFIIGSLIVSVIQSCSINKKRAKEHKNFDATKAKNDAAKFLNNLDAYATEKKRKENEIIALNNDSNEKLRYLKNLPAVENNLPMPNELRSAQGVALLIYYMDTGRAYTLREAIGLYDQSLRDAAKMQELKKQTAYAQEQMLNSRIAAENSRIAAENTRMTYEETKRAADNTEIAARNLGRAASAAEESAYYDRQTYYSRK